MPDSALRVVAVVLAATFGWAAAAKLVAWTRWRTAVSGYGLPGALRTLAAPVVPLAELAVGSLLLIGRTRVAAALTIALLASFSGAVLLGQARRGDRLPCGCFGGAGERDYRVMLARNAVLGLMAASLLASARDVSVTEGWSAPAAGDLVPAGLVALGLAAGTWVVREVRGHR